MEKNEEEKLMSGYFPSNVDEGVDLIFARAKLVNIVVSTILLVPVLLVILAAGYLLISSMSDFFQFIVLLGCIGIVAIAACAIGANDESVPEFLYHVIQYSFTKKTCFYNPRIKSEVVPLSSLSAEALQKNITPRDKMQEWYRQYSEEKTRSHFQESNISFEDIRFEDDIEFEKSLKEKEKKMNDLKKKNLKKKGKSNGKKKKKR